MLPLLSVEYTTIGMWSEGGDTWPSHLSYTFPPLDMHVRILFGKVRKFARTTDTLSIDRALSRPS